MTFFLKRNKRLLSVISTIEWLCYCCLRLRTKENCNLNNNNKNEQRNEKKGVTEKVVGLVGVQETKNRQKKKKNKKNKHTIRTDARSRTNMIKAFFGFFR